MPGLQHPTPAGANVMTWSWRVRSCKLCATIKDGSDGVTEESIVHDILRKDTANRVVLQLLRELQEGKALQTTGAGKELMQSLILLLKGELDQRQFLIFKRALEQLTGKTITNPSRSQKLKGWMIRQFKLIA
ncbi:hypothetical protein FA15DRAFT_753518 [Coprinopsis marcescibilis]|uniref:Uncharacterized protein n=1 Tax=Coprinopsis marcescibilis TaxID=230819 RepID=A0A5C3L773_COPMA|nr:hypothetical protein FA15DRAFT_753518 [Coprinopsis marcescibilis]